MKFMQKDFLFAEIARILLKSKFVRDFLQDVGESASFVSLIKNSLGQVKFFNGREKLWAEIIRRIEMRSRDQQRGICLLEFGLASGDGARWWLWNIPAKSFGYF